MLSTNIDRVVEIFETLLTLKQGNLSLQAHFGRMQALIQEVDLYEPPNTDLVTLKRYHAELYDGIYLSGLRPSIASQLRGSLASLPFSLPLFESRLVCLRPLSLLLQAIRLLPQRWLFLLLELVTMVVSLPALMAIVLLVGMVITFFHHVLTAASKTIPPTSVGSNSASLLLPKRF